MWALAFVFCLVLCGLFQCCVLFGQVFCGGVYVLVYMVPNHIMCHVFFFFFFCFDKDVFGFVWYVLGVALVFFASDNNELL